MRIRLFLTSMLAVMAACPAFADPVIGPNQNEANCSGNTINNANPGDTVAYVADWGANHYKVVYDPGAHAASGVTSYEDEYDATNAPNAGALYDSAYAIKSGGGANAAASQTGIYAADGYNFTGWQSNYDLATGVQSSTPYSGDGTDSVNQYKAANVVTLTAQYSEKQYVIKYLPGTAGSRTVSGNAISESVYFTGSAGNAKAANTFSITGYTFDKWSSDHNISDGTATTTPYAAGTPLGNYNVADNTDMTATWAAKHYTVTYDCNSGNALVQDLIDEYDSTSVPPAGGATYDSPYTFWIVDDICSKSGYTATGWECKDANSTVINQTSNATAWTVDSNVTCYAQWNAKPVYLEWYDGEDEVSGGQPSCEWNVGSITTIPHPTKTGYTFKGWNIQ